MTHDTVILYPSFRPKYAKRPPLSGYVQVAFEEVIRVKNVRLPLVLKEYDAEIRDGIRSVVIFEPAGLCQLYHVDPKTFYRWKHAFRKPARLVWISTRFANHTSFSRKG